MANLNTLKTASAGIIVPVANAIDTMFKEITDGSAKPYHIPSIYSISNRTDSWAYNWSNADDWGNYYIYYNSQTDAERNFWKALGKHTRQNTLSYSNIDMRTYNKIDWATGSVMGGEMTYNTISNNTSYGPVGHRLMFIRNFHPTTSKTITMYGHYSNYWSAGYEGSSVVIGTPNTNRYSTCTSVTWSCPANRTSGNSYYTWSWNVTIPAQTTVAVVQSNSMYYWTSGTGTGYNWLDMNKFYDLNTTFSDPYIQPDLRMTWAANTGNDFSDTTYNNYTANRIWNRTATLYGDR